MDLLKRSDAKHLLTDSMKRIVAGKRFGSYPDVYGRLAWDKPAQTIKRECSHVGNGRYAHPEQDRLCTVREIAALQGFPDSFVFNGAALSNMYRHMGDAVPPLISYQLAHLACWILTGEQPRIEEILLPRTHLSRMDLASAFFLGWPDDKHSHRQSTVRLHPEARPIGCKNHNRKYQ